MGSKRLKRHHGLFAALALAAPAFPALAADKVAFQLDWTPGGISAAYYLGQREGCFTDQDIDVTISRGYGAADAVTKVASGVADFSVTDLGVIIGTIAQTGAPVKAIVPIVPRSPMGLAVLDNSPIRTMRDLEGRSVGSSAGNAAMEYLPLGMTLAGADPSRLKTVTAEASALNGLLFLGRVDALASYVTSAVQIDSVARQSGLKVRSIAYGDEFGVYNASVFTSDRMIAQKPDLVARFAKAVTCSYEKAKADPAATVDAITQGVTGMIRATQENSVPFSLRFAFDNPVFEKNGFRWDDERVARSIEITNKVSPLKTMLTPKDVVYPAIP